MQRNQSPFSLRWVLPGTVLLGAIGSAHAGCSYTGLCGSITFLGKTADASKAVFLVQTTTPGTYSVQATEGGASGPVDTWRADGPGSHVVISPFPAQYGGTHILNSQVIGPGEFVDSAYQRPDGRVFPVGYGVPDSRPATTVVHVSGPNPVVVQSVNQAQPPVAAQPQAHTVAVQNVPPPLVMPDPVRVPPSHASSDSAGVLHPVGMGATIDKQSNPGAVIAPPAQHTQQVAVQLQMPPKPVVPLPGAGVNVPHPVPNGVPTGVQPSTAHTPVVVTAQPNVPVVDKQNNLGAVVSPPAQHVVIQSVGQPGPTSVTHPQHPVIAPAVTQTHLVPVVPVMPTRPQVPGTGLNVPTVVGHPPTSVGNQQGPTQHPPVVIGIQPNVTLEAKQNNAGAVVLPPQSQVVVQAMPQPVLPAGVQVSGPTQTLPPALSERCAHPARDMENRPLSAQACLPNDPPRSVVWGDARNQRTRDMREGVNKQGYRQSRSAGFERAGEGRMSYGLTIGDERESGTVMGDLTRYQTDKQSIGSYAKYAINERWSVIGGVSYTHERTSVAHAPLTGGYQADHLGLVVSLSGYLAKGDNWAVPSVHISRNVIRNHAGHIEGVLGGQPLAVVTPASREHSGAITASYDMGRTVYRSAQMAYVLYGQIAAHYDMTSGVTSPWTGDVRAGLRVRSSSNFTFDLSVSRLGIMNNVSNREVRLTVLQAF